jgi:inorganic triphosphatase YgiF
MSEQELKLHVPHAARTGVEHELKRGAFTRIRLRALYFDTPSRELVQARVALRLRQEGRQWVQTLKMPGEHVLSRVEINHNRPGPVLDLSVYIGTVAEAAISSITEPLGVCYETDVVRLLRKVRSRQGSVEIALDTGCLRAGKLELPISEIEFELLTGKLAAVFELGRKWQHAHGLILDARSKSERGDQLAILAQKLTSIESLPEDMQAPARSTAIAQFWSPRGAMSIKLDADMNAEQALATVTLECLEQITRNAAVLAEVDTAGICKAGNAEHIHQLRVGIRRLRSAWSFFNGITPLATLELRTSVKAYFALLGGTRDDDVLNETILPVLRAAGQPPLVIDQEDAPVAQQDPVATSVEFQAWLLEMLESVLCPVPLETSPAQPPAESSHETTSDSADEATNGPIDAHIIPMQPNKPPRELTLKQSLVVKLRKWHRKVLRDGLKFDELDIESRHELRKQAKKLRYALQFSETLLPAAKLKAYRKQLSAVQDILGEMNDLAVARERFVSLRDTQPSAWFACGWITSRLDALVFEATAAFRQLEKAEKFWR